MNAGSLTSNSFNEFSIKFQFCACVMYRVFCNHIFAPAVGRELIYFITNTWNCLIVVLHVFVFPLDLCVSVFFHGSLFLWFTVPRRRHHTMTTALSSHEVGLSFGCATDYT